MFPGEESYKLRSFVALLYVCLIDCPGAFLNKQSKLQYAFLQLAGATSEQIIYLVNNNPMNLENLEAFVTLLEEAYQTLIT
jgi:hypothetical protein